MRRFEEMKAMRRTMWGRMGVFALSALLVGSAPLVAHANVIEWGANLIGGVTLGAITSPIAVVAWIIYKIASVLLGIAGIIFNWVVSVLVFEFSTYLGNSQGMLLAWGILRDFANIGLLFGFIFLGIATILNLHSYPWKKTLPALVIYAVLLNFSLFITEAIIDGTNLLSATLYSATLAERDCRQGGGGLVNIECHINTGIAGQILTSLSVSQVLGGDNALNNLIQQLTNPIENILKFLLLALLLAIAATVLFAGAFMLLSRAVILAFLMVTSPIGFAGMAIPGLKKIAEDWWEKLIRQALFAPVFILLLLVALKISQSLKSSFPGNLSEAISFSAGVHNTGPLLVYVLVIGFMVAALMIANRFGIYGADLAVRTAGGLTFGTMGLLGRRTIGNYAAGVADRLQTSGRGASGLGRLQLKMANLIAGGSMDARSLTPLKTAASHLKLDASKPSDTARKGFVGVQKARAEREEKLAKSRQDTWKAQDAKYKDAIRQAEIDEERQLAYADEERRRGNIPAAEAFERAASERAAQRKDLEAEYKRAKERRLTEEELLVERRRKRLADEAKGEADTTEAANKAPIEAFAAASEEFKKAEESAAAASENFKKAAEKLERLQEIRLARPSPEVDAAIADATRSKEAAEREYTEEVRKRDLHRAHMDSLRSAAETAQKANADARAAAKKAEDRAAEYSKQIRDPKNALEQMARSYERLAARDPARPVSSFLVRTALNAEGLHAAKMKIRIDHGKSHDDHILDEMRKLIKKGGHEESEPKEAKKAHKDTHDEHDAHGADARGDDHH